MGSHSDQWPFSEVPPGVDNRVRRFRLGDEVDSFAIRTERLLVVVDTLSTPADARLLRAAVADDAAGRALIVVDTHADYDHAWGNSVFADVPIVGHARCGERLRGDEAAADIARWSAAMPGRFDEVVAAPPSILHGDEGLVLDGGDVTIELIHTPGHSDDHVALYLRELGILLAGDAAEVPFPHVDTPTGLVRARASLELLAALGATYVLPCHGGTTPTRSSSSATSRGSTRSWPIRNSPTRRRWSASATAGARYSRCTARSTRMPAGPRRGRADGAS